MENNDLKEKLAQFAQNQTGGAGLVDSTTFSQTETKEITEKDKNKKENEQKRKDILDSLSNETSGIQLAGIKKLHMYNQNHGTHIGWITDRDRKARSFVKVETVKDAQTKKPVLKDSPRPPENIIADFQAGNKVDSKYLKTKGILQIKEDAPGPIRVAAIKMPLTGFKPLDELRRADMEIQISPTAQTEYITHFVSKDDLPLFVSSYFGKSINEDPRTHKDPSKLVVKFTAKAVTNKDNGITEYVTKPSMSIESKKPLIQEGNYFPKTVFKTIAVSEAMKDPAKLEKANFSLFENIFRSTAKKSRSYDKLSAEDLQKVTKDEATGTITSKFFDPKSPVNMGVMDCFTKSAVTDPRIVVKTQVPKKDGDGMTTVVEKYDVVRGGAENADLNPFRLERFATFVAASGPEFTEEKVVELLGTKRTSGSTGSGTAVEIDPEEIIKLYIKSSTTGVSGLKLEPKAFASGKFDALEENIYSVLSKTGR